MSTFSLFDQYMPSPSEVSAERIAAEAAKLRSWIQAARPDVDSRPGSVFDTSFGAPSAMLLAAISTAIERFRQDLNVQGVAGGVATDCDFIRAYLPALGGVEQESVVTAGYALVTFTADEDVVIPPGWTLQFNDAAFTVYDPADTGFTILRRGSSPTTPQQYVLHTVSTGVYGVVLPVTGSSSTTVTAGSTAEVSVLLDNLSTITAVTDFQVGRANNSVSAMARRVLSGFNARDFSTAGGIRELIMGIWPDLLDLTVRRSGDAAVTRTGNNVLGIQQGVVDSWASSIHRNVVMRERIRAVYDAGSDTFVATWTPALTAVALRSVVWTGDTDVDLGAAHDLLIYRSTTAVAAALQLTGSTQHDYALAVPMPRDGADPVITMLTDTSGSYAVFEIEYLAEPAIGHLQRYVDVNSPMGVDIRFRAPSRWDVTSMTCQLVKPQGSVFNEAAARQEIADYLTNNGQAHGANMAAIADSLFYAGASRVDNVQVTAQLRMCPAARFVPYGTADIEDGVAAFLAVASPTPLIQASSLGEMNAEFVHDDSGGYFGPGCIVIDIAPENISFAVRNS